jgi:hypothetical protein
MAAIVSPRRWARPALGTVDDAGNVIDIVHVGRGVAAVLPPELQGRQDGR